MAGIKEIISRKVKDTFPLKAEIVRGDNLQVTTYQANGPIEGSGKKIKLID